ncbi:MAG: hypothetical protein NW201_02955 [Gemmatimonadales bacterium]|nr:hypothetical protein [Gemmatimonadales bacterium]
MSRRLLLAVLTLAACRAGGGADAQQVTDATIEATLPGRFGTLSNVVGTATGKVLFADTKARRLFVGDFAAGRADSIGVARTDTLKADAPAEQYKFPGSLTLVGPDSVAVVDFAALRVTTWSSAGKALGVLRVPAVLGPAPVVNYDQRGRGYKVDFAAILGGSEPGTAIRPDSIAVVRFPLATGTFDTVAFLQAPEYGDAYVGEQMQQVPRVFGPNDYMGVLPDGAVWVARGRQNRVDWVLADGRRVRGTARAFEKVKVSDADTARVIAQLRERGLPQQVPVQFPFAETKPPFENAIGNPRGEVWLQRSRASDTEPAVYDVWGQDGTWKRAVRCPAGVTVAGFGAGGEVYASRRNDDGSRSVVRLKA